MLNKAILMGRLTKDPELRSTQGGASVSTFCLAVERSFKDKDGNKKTDFINCVAWRQTAEFISRYFRKGNLIAIVGNIQSRSFKDKDGNSRSVIEVVAEEASFTGEKTQEPADYSDVFDDPEEELPF